MGTLFEAARGPNGKIGMGPSLGGVGRPSGGVGRGNRILDTQGSSRNGVPDRGETYFLQVCRDMFDHGWTLVSCQLPVVLVTAYSYARILEKPLSGRRRHIPAPAHNLSRTRRYFGGITIRCPLLGQLR